MRNLLRKSLESEFVDVDTPPEEDLMMNQFQEYFPNHFEQNEGGWVLEERADGKADKEKEHTIYARLINMDQLKKAASMEHQEQWEIKIEQTDENAGKGQFRVRKTWIDGGQPAYVRVTKIPYNEAGDKIEIPLESNQDEFTAFKFLSDRGMIKDRFHFPIVGTQLVWEFDLFPKQGGGYQEWVKIDLEVPDKDAPLPEFPIELEDIILPKELSNLSEEEWEAKVQPLYGDIFISKNEFKSGMIQHQPDGGVATNDPTKPKAQDDQSAAKDEAVPDAAQKPKENADGENASGTDAPADNTAEGDSAAGGAPAAGGEAGGAGTEASGGSDDDADNNGSNKPKAQDEDDENAESATDGKQAQPA